MHTSLIKARSRQRIQSARSTRLSSARLRELEARHSLLNLSVHDLVEEFARHVLSQVSLCTQQRNYSLRPSCLIRLQH
ncbi:hypothetical protein HBH97_246340 [Parastagonospora nodorum]|nr:hypothetical protein HBH97_246340 [Parastagonospora nodorum]